MEYLTEIQLILGALELEIYILYDKMPDFLVYGFVLVAMLIFFFMVKTIVDILKR